MAWDDNDKWKKSTLNPISVYFMYRCCCFFKRKKKKSGRQKWLSVTVGLGGAIQCGDNNTQDGEDCEGGLEGGRGGDAEGAVTINKIGKRGTADTGTGTGTGTDREHMSNDAEKEAATLLYAGSRSASRDSVLHTTVTMTPTPTPPPLSNWISLHGHHANAKHY